MFEKEAEEYWYDSGSNEFDIGQVEKACKQSFKDGAEFAYKKANEWHYPSKGEYPKDEGEYLVIFESDRTKYKGLESYYPDTKEWSTICKIIAWKEIIPPKEVSE